MTVRSGMSNLIEELRGMAEAGTADYTVGASNYWDDGQVQDILDNHRDDLRFVELAIYPQVVSGGTLQYYDYRAPVGFFEETTGGTAVFFVQASNGATMGTALWNVDYRRGAFTFTQDMRGTVLFLTGRSYDLNAAAADLWRMKAAHYAPSTFNFSTDNHSVSRAQVYDHCTDMAKYFQGISRSAISVVDRFRGDVY